MRSRTAPADSSNTIRNHLNKIRQARAEVEAKPDDLTPKVTLWRNSIDNLQRELEKQAKYISSLREVSEDPNKVRELRFREALYSVIKDIGEEFKSLVGILKNTTHLSKNSEFSSWDLVSLSLRSELSKCIIAGNEGPEQAIAMLRHVYQFRDNILAQILQSFLHKKIVLWMDLGLQSEEYVKGEVLTAWQRILKSQADLGHIPTRCDFIQPKADPNDLKGYIPELKSVLSSFTEEFGATVRMIENNFKLHGDSKTSPYVPSLREEIENNKKQIYNLEKELLAARSMLKSPDKRELISINRDVIETNHKLELANANAQRLKIEKINLESKNIEYIQNIEDMQTRLKTLNESVFPRLEDLERTQEEIMNELKKIRQDADLLPEMFRNEVKLKKTIREEKLQAEEKMKKIFEELEEARNSRHKLEQERDRKERISLQAIAAKNIIDQYLKEANIKLEEQKKNIAENNLHMEKLSKDVEQYKGQYLELQEHMYVLNNRINELEDQKKALIDQLKAIGVQSKAHYVHRRLDKN
ncbi:hypothetical protein SteCoe_27585 [Stentor coeruleus]|uniref:Uncharacterized protein n=1 Tax=Stentor coeruleus TaxID=5963 RepID=A0A1R2BA72_9CILI|nr:hypothetical protein SteCoe_27585 [Stentor coeruleus]